MTYHPIPSQRLEVAVLHTHTQKKKKEWKDIIYVHNLNNNNRPKKKKKSITRHVILAHGPGQWLLPLI